jgi:hypothetical protein
MEYREPVRELTPREAVALGPVRAEAHYRKMGWPRDKRHHEVDGLMRRTHLEQREAQKARRI